MNMLFAHGFLANFQPIFHVMEVVFSVREKTDG